METPHRRRHGPILYLKQWGRGMGRGERGTCKALILAWRREQTKAGPAAAPALPKAAATATSLHILTITCPCLVPVLWLPGA